MNRPALPAPETLVGHCCGCHAFPVALFKVPTLYRYRCADCFKRETGHAHHLAPDDVRLALALAYFSRMSDRQDYHVMLARTRARVRGATPAEIQHHVFALDPFLHGAQS